MVCVRCVVAMLANLLCAIGAVPNPSGSCQASSDGSRHGYHFPAATDTYLPDCNLTLEREYWRVFAVDAQQAYIMPRPDGTGLLFGICSDTGSDLASLFERYDLCKETVDDPSVVNNMAPKDALEIAHALHEHLVFVEKDGEISPFAPDDDVLAACALTDDASVQDFCEAVRGRCDSKGVCIEIAITPGKAAATVIAAALNELYGIVASRDSSTATGFTAWGAKSPMPVGAIASVLLRL